MTGEASARSRAADVALVGVFVSLPLFTSVQELTMAGALLLALALPTRAALLDEPWGRPALAVAAIWVLLVPASGDVREGFGHAWLLAPLLAVPALLRAPGGAARRALAERAGWAAACAAAVWAIGQRGLGSVGTAGLSHHLSLAYALLPPLGVAVAARRVGIAVLLASGVLATGSAGAVVALAVTVAAAGLPDRLGPVRSRWLALGAGIAATLLLLPFADAGEVHQRAILWTGGLSVAESGAAGPGAYAAAAAPFYDRLEPGFWFPNHAHDSGVQLLAVLGPAGLLATAALCLAALTHGAPGAAAGLAGVLVGALTQEVLGDLEVARAAWAWLALAGLGNTRVPELAGDPSSPSAKSGTADRATDTDPP